MRVLDLVAAIDRIAPFRLAEEWDNVGLQTGSPNASALRTMFALEVNPAVLAEAAERKANALVVHHPLIFRELANLVETNGINRMVAECVRMGLSVVAAHTNLDRVAEGTSGEIADRLRLQRREFLQPAPLPDHVNYGYGLVGDLPRAMTLDQLAEQCRVQFQCPVVGIIGPLDADLRRAAVFSGSGGPAIASLDGASADVLITGELTHHQCADLRETGRCGILLGHFESEVIVMPRLRMLLEADPVVRAFKPEMFDSKKQASPLRRL